MDTAGHFHAERTVYGWRLLARDEAAEWAEATLRRLCGELSIPEPKMVLIEQTLPWEFEARAFVPRGRYAPEGCGGLG